MNENLGARLKEAREAKALTLEQAAAATRINKQYLAAIEEGRSINLPDLYLKAFIKDYSEFLGIGDDADVQQPKGESKNEPGRIASTVTAQVVTTNLPGSTAIKYPSQLRKPKRSAQFRLLMLITLVMLFAFVAIIIWMQREKLPTTAQEIKFSEVAKEWTKKQPDTSQSPFLTGATDSISGIDTLVLEGAAVETVWVRVVIDGEDMKEYNLLPMGRFRCEGKQYFELSTDNSRGIILSFNGKRIGTLSQMKKPFWNVTVSPTTLEQLHKMAAGKGSS